MLNFDYTEVLSLPQMAHMCIAILAAIGFLILAYTVLQAKTERWKDNAMVSLVISIILVVPVPQFAFLLPLLCLYQFAMIQFFANLPSSWRVMARRSIFGRDIFVAMGVA